MLKRPPAIAIIATVAVFLSILIIILASPKPLIQAKTQTDVEVMAMVGIPAENKLGGIQFAVSDRWGYDRVIFQVWGFDEGLTLDNVVCRKYDNGKYIKEGFVRWNSDWNTWPGRYREVLAETTIGEKNFLDPNAISIE